MHQHIRQSYQYRIRHRSSQYPYPHVAQQKRPPDKRPAGSHQLHGMNKKTFRIYRQPDGIVDKRKRNKRKQCRQSEQNNTDLPDITVYRIQQILRVIDLYHLLVLRLNLILYPRNAVRICVIRIQLHLDGSRKRIMPQKLRRICSHRLRLLLQGLRLRYIRRLLYIYLLVQLFLKAENIRLLHIITDQN